MGGSGGRFPPTQLSAVVAAASSDDAERRRGLEALIAGYWKPVYKYLRIKWRAPNEEAKDLVQGFFSTALEKDWFAGYDPAAGTFRTWLRTCLDRFVANQRRAESRQKRGGDRTLLSLDFEGVEGEYLRAPAGDDANPEEYFHREWVRSLFGMAVDELSKSCADAGKQTHFDLFRRYDLEGGDGLSYADLAREFELPVTQVTNYLAWARREFRRIVLERLREICGSDREFRAEARELLGVETP